MRLKSKIAKTFTCIFCLLGLCSAEFTVWAYVVEDDNNDTPVPLAGIYVRDNRNNPCDLAERVLTDENGYAAITVISNCNSPIKFMAVTENGQAGSATFKDSIPPMPPDSFKIKIGWVIEDGIIIGRYG